MQYAEKTQNDFGGNLEAYERLIMETLMISIDQYQGSLKKLIKKIQYRAFEAFSLLIILNESMFLKHNQMLTGFIKNELQATNKVNPQLYLAIKCIFDSITANNFLVSQQLTTQDEEEEIPQLDSEKLDSDIIEQPV